MHLKMPRLSRGWSLIALAAALAFAVPAFGQGSSDNPHDQNAQGDQGTTFRDLVGVNRYPYGTQGDQPELVKTAIGYGRQYVYWGHVQPTEDGGYHDKPIQKFIDRYKANQRHGVEVLAGLAYTPNWAEDHSTKTYHFQGVTYRITRNDKGKLHIKCTGFGDLDLDADIAGSWNLALAPDHVSDWVGYVTHVVSKLQQAGVQYFQIWNEPDGRPPFYTGDMDMPGHGGDSDAAAIANDTADNFYNLVHKPAADAIHKLGGKVVFGGWPTPKAIGDFADWLDYHTTPDPNDKQDAWDTVDVLDFHYRSPAAMEEIRQRAAQVGRPDIPIWQTEIGNNGSAQFIPSYYPRFAQWALKHNDGDPGRYRVYYYPYAGPWHNKKVSDHNKLLIFTGRGHNHELTENGIALMTMGKLLGGGPMHVYQGVSNDQGLHFNLNDRNPKKHTTQGTASIEAFKVNHRIIVALHLDETTHGNMTLTFNKLDKARVAAADRVTPYGKRADLMDTLQPRGEGDSGQGAGGDSGGVSLTVPTDHIARPSGGEMKSTGRFPRTLFVELRLHPAS